MGALVGGMLAVLAPNACDQYQQAFAAQLVQAIDCLRRSRDDWKN